jgi:hypothetical protein
MAGVAKGIRDLQEREVRHAQREAAGSESSQTGVIARYEALGFKGQFGSRPGGKVACFTCRKEHDAGKVKVQALHRLEGASDPADEMSVAALVCPSCGAKGTLSLSYGATASAEDRLVLKRLSDRRDTSGIQPGI